MKEFTKEMLDKLHKAHDELRGTPDHWLYTMECEMKTESGRWEFMGHCLPYRTGTIKTFKGKTYIMTKDAYGVLTRYEVTNLEKELLNI